jgi:gliding motility-associated-like protein
MLRLPALRLSFVLVLLSICLGGRAQYFPGGQPVLNATPAPPWGPGQCVNFSMTVAGFVENPIYVNPNPPPATISGLNIWFHGIGITPSPCWGPITYGAMPASLYSTGNFVVDLGQIIPGIYYESNVGCPGVCNATTTVDNYGDGAGGQPFPPGNGPWTFSWSACVPATPPSPCALTMGVTVFGDGETGSWINVPPTGEPPIQYPFPQNLSGFSLPSPFCKDSIMNLPAFAASPNNIFNFNFGGAAILSGSGNGPYSLKWTTTGTKTIIRTATDTINNTVVFDTAYVVIVPIAVPTFSLSSTAVCMVRDTATVTFTGSAQTGSTFNWNFAGGTIISGANSGPYRIVWAGPGAKVVSLTITNGSCISNRFQVPITVGDTANQKIDVAATACVDSVVTLTSSFCIPPSNVTFSWNFDGAAVISGTGIGPYTLSWPSAGTKKIIRTTTYLSTNEFVRDSTTIDISNPPSSAFTIDKTGACLAEPVIIAYTGNAALIDSFAWDFDGATVLGGSGGGPYTVLWGTTGFKNVTLRVFDGGCQSILNTVVINVTNRPGFNVTNQGAFCIGFAQDIEYVGDPTAIITWNFDGGVLFNGGAAVGPGPHAVIWYTPGPKVVAVTATYPGCIQTRTFRYTIKPQPEVSLPQTAYYCQGGPGVQLNGAIAGLNVDCSFRWEPTTGLDNPNSLTPLASPATTTLYQLIAECVTCGSDTASILVTTAPRPTASVAQAIVRTCQGSGGVPLQGSGTGGSGVLTYQWTPSLGLNNNLIDNPIANPTVTTVYWLKVSDENNCTSDSVSVTVRVDAIPVVDAGPDASICDNNPVQLAGVVTAGSGSYTYSWSPTTGLSSSTIPNPTAFPLTTTIYTLTVTDLGTGCPSPPADTLSTVVVRRATRPIANAGPSRVVMCLGDSIQIGGLAYGSGPDYTYQWSPTTGLSNPTSAFPIARPTLTTTYFLRVISNGCISTLDTATVVVRTRPNFAINTNALQVCPNSPTQLTITATGANLLYRWRPAIGLSDSTVAQPILTADSSRRYFLAVYTPDCAPGPEDFVDVTVRNTATVLADSNNTPGGIRYCTDLNAGVVLPAKVAATGSFIVQWTPTNGLSATNVLNPIARPTVNTFYEIAVTNNGCVVRDTVLVVALPGVDARILQNDTTICEGSTIPLPVSGGVGSASYLWTPPAGLSSTVSGNPMATPTANITYKVVVSEAGCFSEDTVQIRIAPQSLAKFSANPVEGCASLEVSFFDSSATTIEREWDFGDGTKSKQTAPIHTYANAGLYRVALRALAPTRYCSDTFYQTIRVFAPGVAAFESNPLASDTLYLPNTLVKFQDKTTKAISWLWNFGDGSSSTEKNPEHLFREVDSVGFKVLLITTDSNGCVDRVQHGPYIVVPPLFKEIQNVFTPNGDGANDLFQVIYTGNEKFRLFVFDRSGKQVFSANNAATGWNGLMNNNGSELPEAVYFYTLTVGNRLFKGTVTLLR